MAIPEAAVTLYLQLHLPCDQNLEGKPGGRTRQGVSRLGRVIAKSLEPRLERIGPIAAILTSSLPRATETASLYYRDAGVPIVEDERFCAIDYGAYQERPVTEIVRLQPDHVNREFPDGESFSQMASRYRSALDDVLRTWPGRRVLLIGHNESAAMLRHLCDAVPLGEALVENTLRRPPARDLVEHYASYMGPYVYDGTART